MQKATIQFDFEVYDSINELTPSDKTMLEAAREVTKIAYAPYSDFHVGAVAKLTNGDVVKGTNQENASFPVSICAERVLMSSAAMTHTNIPIETMAIAYHNLNGKSNKPVSPCGMCRQALVEYEDRTKHTIRLILSGMEGQVYIIEKASMLLPMSFGGGDMV